MSEKIWDTAWALSKALELGAKQERERLRESVKSSQTQLAGLAGIGNAVLIEEMLLEMIGEEVG